MRYIEHRIAAPDGLALYVREYPPRGAVAAFLRRLWAAARHRPAPAWPHGPAVCLHGLTRNADDFEAVAPGIARMGRRTIALDVRGRGRSAHDPAGRYRPDVYARDVIAVMDALGVDRAVFVGTSMGGVIAMLLAATAPARVAGAVLNDIGVSVERSGLARITSYVGKRTSFASLAEAAAAIRAEQGALFPGRGERFWRTFARRVTVRREGRLHFAYDPAIARAAAATPPPLPLALMPLFLALAPVPVLLVRGGLSDLLSRATVDMMKAAKPDLETVEIPATGHAPTLEEPLARQALAGFLARIP